MSYLDVPRLSFFGQFLANPGTINNILSNYDPHNPTRPLWNPKGVAFFQLQGENVNGTQMTGVTVTSVLDASGNLVTSPSQDPLIGAAVQSNPGTSAKIVDLDPWQQLISQLFGLQFQVVIGGSGGSNAGFSMKERQFAAVPSLTDLWFVRSPQGGPSGIFQTILQADQIEWNDPGASPLLQQFQEACTCGISVKFTVDLYDTTSTSPTFNLGRIAGAFGPAKASEPVRFPVRKLVPQVPDGGNPQSVNFWSAPLAIDETRAKAVLDIGNSFQIQQNPKTGAEESVPVGTATAVILASGGTISLSPPLDYSQTQYELTAGIVEVDLTPDQLAAIQENAVGIVTESTGDSPVLAEAEPYVNLSQTFLRLSPGDSADVQLQAFRYGRPLAGETLSAELIQPGFFQQNFPQYPGLDQQIQPGSSEPASGIAFPASVTTDPTGTATLQITAHVPQPLPAPREFIDSQIYFLGGSWQGSAYFWWPMSFAPLSVVIYDAFTIPQHPTWTQDVQPVMAQYMRLYPGMRDILDMANYDVVKQNAQALQKVFSLAITDPGRMPVTRDLAPVKMQMVLDWIAAGLPI